MNLTEKLMIERTVYCGDGTQTARSNRELASHICAPAHMPERMAELVGKRCTFHAGAPGIGHHTWEVTRVDQDGIWGRTIENTIHVPEYC